MWSPLSPESEHSVLPRRPPANTHDPPPAQRHVSSHGQDTKQFSRAPYPSSHTSREPRRRCGRRVRIGCGGTSAEVRASEAAFNIERKSPNDMAGSVLSQESRAPSSRVASQRTKRTQRVHFVCARSTSSSTLASRQHPRRTQPSFRRSCLLVRPGGVVRGARSRERLASTSVRARSATVA